MTTAASVTMRWARASVLGAVVLAVGVVAHVSANGRLPGPVGLLALYAASVAGSALFLGREAPTVRLVALTVGGQGFVHSGLAAMAGHRGDPVSSSIAANPTHPEVAWNPRSGESYDQWVRHLTHGQSSDVLVPAWVTHAVADMAAHPWMALAHVFAAAAVGAWLSVGERALWSLVVLASTSVATLVRSLCERLSERVPVRPAVAIASVPSDTGRPPLVVRTWASVVVRRGPPVVLPVR